MDFFSRTLMYSLIPLAINLFLIIEALETSKNKITDEECVIIHYSKTVKFLVYIGFFTFSTGSVFALSSKKTTDFYAGIFFVIDSLLFLFLVLKVLSWKIYVYKTTDYFKIRTFLFITHTIKYKDCKIWRGKDEYKIKTGRRTFLSIKI